jgi:hypothetical protein
VSLVGGTDFQLRGESNLADVHWMCEAKKTIHSERRLPTVSELRWAGSFLKALVGASEND